jgi:hypothetical protein
VQRSYLFANDANVLFFAIKKVKAFERLTIFVGKKSDQRALFTKKAALKTCNE